MKKGFVNPTFNRRILLKKIIMIKLTCILSIIFALRLSANSDNLYSQITKIDLETDNMSLEGLIWEIKKKTEFDFFYSTDDVSNIDAISLDLQNVTIDEILAEALKKTDLMYNVVNKAVIIKKLEKKELLKFLPIAELELQLQEQVIKGIVVDTEGVPLPGVNVVEKGTTNGSVTNINGEYTITLRSSSSSALVFSFVGFLSEEIVVGDQVVINVTLVPDVTELDEIVVVGYGTKKKATLTGSIASVGSDEIISTKSQNVQNMLTGKVSGVRVIQKTSEPGQFDNQFDIRGFGAPLIVVDGVPRSDIQRLDPNEIESVTVLKDASAAIYGVRAANGVVLVTTKTGKEGKPQLSYTGYFGTQIPAEVLKPVGAVDRMLLFNEKSMRNYGNPLLTYSDEQIEAYLSGAKASTDWYNEILRNSAPQQQHNLSMSGGSETVNYFVNLGYSTQEGFWKSGSLNYQKMNLRSNLEMKLSDRLKVSVKLNGIIDETNRPYTSSWEIFKNLWRQIPNDPVFLNNDPNYLTKVVDIKNAAALVDSDISGYNENKNKILQTSVDITYDVPFVKGLSLKGMLSYDPRISDNSTYKKAYNEYTYDEATDSYTMYTQNSPSTLNRYYGNSENLLYQFSFNYEKTIAENHNLSVLALFEASHNQSDNFNGERELTIPIDELYIGNTVNQQGTSNPDGIGEYASNALVGRVNYDYAGKYMFEYSFRYDGSSKFPENSQWGFFPGVQLAWRISEESFIKDNMSYVDNIKVRGTYGVMGDDGAAKYQFISGYDYPNTSGAQFNNYPIGYVFGGNNTNALGFRATENNNITWYTSKSLNLGLDVDLWRGKLGVTFDIFKRDREGLLANRSVTVPGTFGSDMPQENLNSDQTKGFEIELRHKNVLGDFSYNISGNVSITRTKNIYVEGQDKANYGNSWDYWRHSSTDRYNDIWFGWGANGKYETYEEIATSDVRTGTGTLPGDYIYEDWNDDGVIDDYDRYPIATTTNPTKATQEKRNYPLMFFGLNLSAQYKGFDVGVLLQGAGMSYIAYSEQLSSPLAWNGNALDFFLDRWHPVDPNADPWDPNNEWSTGYYQYGGVAADTDSEFLIQSGAYVRLKTIELGYTLPNKLTSKIGISKLRLFTNGYNLLTITGVEGVDPEHPTDLYGYMYPLNQTINFGANVTF